jgi:hypothetical protein
MEHNENDPMCKCEKCMTSKAADMCTSDAPCGNCEKCMNKDMIDTSPVAENPSTHLNPAAGMKHPELHNPLSLSCKCDKCMGMKTLFSDFAKDHSKTQQLKEIFKDI